MEARLLRTLSDNGEPLPANQQANQPLQLGVLDNMLVEGPVAGVMVDQQLTVSSPASESSKAESDCEASGAMGDEDEGFDEEFCDSEEPPPRPAPSNRLPPLNLQELNSTDIQSLLMENSLADGDSLAAIVPPFPTPSLLDDIDPGVFMTDMEQSSHPLLGVEGKSPIHSPFPLSSPSPVCATLNSMTLGDSQAMVGSPSPMDEWSTHSMLNYPIYSDAASSVGDSEYGSTVDVCSSSQYLFPAPSPPPSSAHSTGQQYNFDMLYSHQPQATPFTCHSPSPTPSYHHSPVHLNLVNSYNGGSSPSHSSHPPTPPPSSLPHVVPSPGPYHPQSTPSYEGDPLVSGQFTLMHGGAPSPNPSLHGTATTPSSDFASCSTQTPLNRAQSPAPSQSHTHQTNSDTPKSKQTPAAGEEKIVHMPFYKFRKILESPTVSVEKKSDIKNVRRRGKNKIAAKNCRQRKQELVLGLQQEIDGLRMHRKDFFVKTGTLKREIELLRSQCLALFHRNKQQLLPH